MVRVGMIFRVMVQFSISIQWRVTSENLSTVSFKS